MALQLRRGQNAQRTTTLLAQGELVYVTDNATAQVSPLFIGDGSTTGGIPVVRVVSVNGQIGAIFLDSDDMTEGATNKYYTTERAQDDVASMLLAGTHTGITFTYNPTPQDQGNRIDVSVSASGTVNSGTTGSLAYWATNGTALTASASITWDESTNLLKIDSGTLTVFGNTSGRSLLNLDTHAIGTPGNSLRFSRSRGTQLAPTILVTGDILGNLSFSGYDGLAYNPAATITSYVAQPVSLNVVPTGVGIFTTGVDGIIRQNLRVTEVGATYIGPATPGVDTTGSGRLHINSTVNPTSNLVNNSSLTIATFFEGQDSQNIAVSRARGTLSVPTVIQNGDDIVDIVFYGFDGNVNSLSAQITSTVDGPVSSNNVPGSLKFGVKLVGGAMTYTTKIDSAAVLTHNGTIATARVPGTFWNYDTSASTITMTVGQTLVFANFSGSVLVNCYVSGTITQYLCGGTNTSAFSSTSPNTGTMAHNSGASGYTFTSTEAGVHSFYVVRTRAAA
jgi:hypothetical protein